jgi:Ca2+:H+ antiporter
MDRSMTLYFHGYETTCLFFGTIVTVAVLQGGTSNWLTGAMMVGIYVMMATGVYFHELEDLSLDAELLIRNMTTSRDV